MPDRQAAKHIFMAALDLDPAERPAFIAAQCKGDAALQREVEDLLAAHEGKPILDPATLPAQPANNAAPKSKNIAGSARVGEEIGPYRLLERIGEGGFGEVWIAEQKTPVRRKVALKIIKAGMDTREVLARFEAERQALAVMDHPCVAKVFDAGATGGGRPYFVMEYVAGLPINAYCDSSRLRIKERLRLFMNICHAVQHAHQKGIIHRDLKPGNIIVTLQDGKPVPKVIDFGIAKATIGRLTERTLYTETGRVIGTPEYMAPEQAGTSGLDVDTRADIYSLGVILYELLTGTLPLDGNTLRSAGFEAIGKMLKEFEPPKPSTRLSTMATEPVTRGKAEPDSIAQTHGTDLRTLQRELRGDLDWITLKALEKDRTRRYETASAFAADVDRHLTGEPVIAAPPSMGYRLRKFARKHRAGAVIAATLVLATITTSGMSVWAIREREQKERERAQALKANEKLKTLIAKAKDGFEKVANESIPAMGLIATTQEAVATLLSIKPGAHFSGTTLLDVNGEQGTSKFRISPENPDDDANASGMMDRIVDEAISNIKKNKELTTSLQNERDAAKLSAYAANLGAAQQAMAFKAWPEARAKLDAIDPEMRGWEWRFLHQKAYAILLEFQGVTCSEFSPINRHILIAADHAARLWDAATGKPVGEAMRHGSYVDSAVFSPDGKLILTASNGFARLWDSATFKPVGEPMRLKGNVTTAEFSPDGKLILTAGSDSFARLWDAATGKPVGEPMRHRSSAVTAGFSPDGKLVLTASYDGFARLWDSPTGKPAGEAMRHEGDDEYLNLTKFSPDSKLILTASDGFAQLWDSATGKPVGEAVRHEGDDEYLNLTKFSPDSKLILTASDGFAQLWDSATGKPVGEAVRHGSYVDSAVFSPDGKLILTAGSDGFARLWDAATGKPVGEPMPHKGQVTSAEFSPDGKLILTAGSDGFARLWDAATGMSTGEVGFPFQDDLPSTSASFSPDGQLTMLRSVGDTSDGNAYVHSTTHFLVPERRLTGEDVDLEVAAIMDDPPQMQDSAACAGGTNSIANKVTSPDDSREVVVGSDRSVEFYAKVSDLLHPAGGDVGQSARIGELATIRLDEQPTGLAFSPDGTRLVVLLEDQSALVWDTRGPEAQQADRDARAAERKHATKLVDVLWAGATPLDQLDSAIRNDNSISALRQLVALDVLRERIAALNSGLQQEFDRVIKECVTTSRAMAWVRRLEPLPNDATPLARRIREGLEKKITEWKSDAQWLNAEAWAAVSRADSSPERIAAAIEAASMALGMNPDDGDSLKNLGAAQYRTGQYEDALKNLTKAVAIFETNGVLYPKTLSFVAMCQVVMGRFMDARSNLVKVSQSYQFLVNGHIEGRSIIFPIDDEFGSMDQCRLELSPDGQHISGKYGVDDESLWKVWTGSRRSRIGTDRFDGLWSTTQGDMWLTTDGDKVFGMYNLEGVALELEAVELYESAIAASAQADQPASSQPVSTKTTQPTYEQSPASQPADQPSTPSPTTQPS